MTCIDVIDLSYNFLECFCLPLFLVCSFLAKVVRQQSDLFTNKTCHKIWMCLIFARCFVTVAMLIRIQLSLNNLIFPISFIVWPFLPATKESHVQID